MALSGTLSDLGIVDLIQFPGTGKKTGELIIAGIDDEARLFYEQGLLKHIACGPHEGMDALIDLVSWEEGEFEFRMGSTCEESTIKTDLHRALMVALKTRDERREEARKKALAEQEQAQRMSEQNTIVPDVNSQPPADVDAARMQHILTEAVATFPYIEFASVYQRTGARICIWSRDNADISAFNKIVTSISDVFNSHPRQELQKVYLTDNFGTCIGSAVGSSLLLFLAASEESSLGVVSIAASKIATAIMGGGE